MFYNGIAAIVASIRIAARRRNTRPSSLIDDAADMLRRRQASGFHPPTHLADVIHAIGVGDRLARHIIRGAKKWGAPMLSSSQIAYSCSARLLPILKLACLIITAAAHAGR